MLKNKTLLILPALLSSLLLSACGAKQQSVSFSNDDAATDSEVPYTDKLAKQPINYTNTYNLNQEFKITYKTANPDGTGTAEFKAKSFKQVDSVADRQPEDGKKLYLLEIAIRGNTKNKGEPSTFNQIGDNPSPQFILADKANNTSYVEETYYSDAYTQSKNLFELTKITLDHDQWVNTAIAFQVSKDLNPELAFRFTSADGKTEFYAIK